jgi:hypothetical protein
MNEEIWKFAAVAVTAKPAADVVIKAMEIARDAIGSVLGPICTPVAEEIGVAIKDQIAYRHACNLISMMKNLKEKLAACNVPSGATADPRMVQMVMEKAQWIEDSVVQEMWVGLLSSSCTPEGDDDSNLIFTTLLAGMTKLQARILRYACEIADKVEGPEHLIYANRLMIEIEKLAEVSGESDIQRLDRELEYLRAVSLLDQARGGILPHAPKHTLLTPTALALHMYVRCQGSRLTPLEFFRRIPTTDPPSMGSVSTIG